MQVQGWGPEYSLIRCCAHEAASEGAGDGSVECARPTPDASGLCKVYTGKV